jgi:hypothetical protein
MFGRTFSYNTLRRYVALFGTLFNDIWIYRKDNDGNVKQTMKVPLTYSPREKLLARVEGMESDRDPLRQPFAITLPRMGFEITGFSYAAERKLPTINRFIREDLSDNSKIRKYQYNPVPYDIQFALSVFVKNTNDGTMIIEQILPFFTPEWTTTVQLVDDPRIVLDVPLVINDVSQDDVYEGSFEERRSLIWTMNFTMKGFFFGPTKRQGIITLANTQFLDATLFEDIEDAVGLAEPSSRITITPGLDANGNPTTDPNETVDRDEISSTDDWAPIINIESPIEP